MSCSSSRRTGWPTTATVRGSSSRTDRWVRPSPSRIRAGSIHGSCARPSARLPRVPSGSVSSAAATDRHRAADPRVARPRSRHTDRQHSRHHAHSQEVSNMSQNGYATENALVDSDWALAHLDDPNVRFVEVDVDTTAYEQSHLPGAVGWNWTSQLSDGIRRDIAGREDFSKLLSRIGDRPGHHDRAVRRQQQLVRGVGLLAAQAVRPRRRPDPQRRSQVLARQRPEAQRRRARRTRRRTTSCPSPTSACAPSATTSCRGSAMRAWRWSTSAPRPSTTARSSRPRA